MSTVKHIAITAITVLAVVAVATRIPAVRKFVLNTTT